VQTTGLDIHQSATVGTGFLWLQTVLEQDSDVASTKPSPQGSVDEMNIDCNGRGEIEERQGIMKRGGNFGRRPWHAELAKVIKPDTF
jgi:hypothetical protein